MKPLAAVLVTAGALLIGGGSAARAQPADGSKPGAARTTATHKPTKTAAARPAAASPYEGEPGKLSDYWTVDRALPSRSATERRSSPDGAPALGRVPLQNAPGSVGIASGTVRGSEFYDGRPVPGLTQNTRGDSSYVGLSLSMPSNNNAFLLPVPSVGSSSGW